jgi:hypothetical protein
MADSPSSGAAECAAAVRRQAEAEDAPRGEGEAIVGRLPVDQKHGPRRRGIRDRRPLAAPLFADHEQQPDAPLAVGPQALRRRDLRREDALGVARAAPMQRPVAHVARKERRHAVEVRGQHDGGSIETREHVESSVRDRLALHLVAETLQPRGQPFARRLLPAGRGVDVDELPGERDGVWPIHASSRSMPLAYPCL